jgi:D-alanyl-lipoteichoic acid acyltransferase DltB (MBOAT superfamily)
MMNVDLPENFDSPYRAHSVVEFWRRWHMTLTRFFNKYIYRPLGGSKKGVARTSINVLLVFLISGIWHGAAWSFVLWGLCHGVLSVLTRLAYALCGRVCGDPDKDRPLGKELGGIRSSLLRAVGVVFTFSAVSLLWVLFRAESVSEALLFFERLFTDGSLAMRSALLRPFAASDLTSLLTTLLRFNPYTKFPPAMMLGYFALSLLVVFAAPKARSLGERFKPTLPRLVLVCVLLVWCVYSLSGVSTFLYFNF